MAYISAVRQFTVENGRIPSSFGAMESTLLIVHRDLRDSAKLSNFAEQLLKFRYEIIHEDRRGGPMYLNVDTFRYVFKYEYGTYAYNGSRRYSFYLLDMTDSVYNGAIPVDRIGTANFDASVKAFFRNLDKEWSKLHDN